MSEVWVRISSAPDYQVTNLGRVRRRETGVVLKPWKHASGHLYLKLAVGGRKKSFQIHRLVAIAFIGDPPTPRHEVRHLDGNPLNNSLGNLAWGTRMDNMIDLVRTNDKMPRSTTTFEIANEIRRRFTGKRGEQKLLATEYGLGRDVVCRLLSGRTYTARLA